jgi:DNA-binding transcriptional MerR regulator
VRAKEIADLTGTTVRAIRHYHAIELLPVPEVRYGRRDYDLSHVARVSRIRWLAESGLPLARIASILAEDVEPGGSDQRKSVLVDLRATLDVLQERIESLGDQRNRLAGLVDAVEKGESLSSLPPAVAAFYDVLTARAPDELTRRGVRREREFLELAYLRGEVPPEAEMLFVAVDEQSSATSLEAFANTLTGELTDETVEQTAVGIVERMKHGFGDRLPAVSQTIDTEALRRLYDLFSATGDERDRRMGEAVLRHLLGAIEEAKST